MPTPAAAEPCVAAYLGPAGTFSHEAAASVHTARPQELLPLATVVDVIRHVHEHPAHLGVVPIENSVEGEVTSTMDALIFEFDDVFVREEIVVGVGFGAWRHAWFANEPMPPLTALSHPHALAQCKRFVRERGLEARAVSSTAEACRMVAEEGDPRLVALASPGAAERYGLAPFAEHVEDHPGATTRFFVLGQHLAAPTGNDKTTLVVLPPSDRAGLLFDVLHAFAVGGINLTAIHSRPLRSDLGRYCFVLTAEGHVLDDAFEAALDELFRLGAEVKVLGAYPVWPGDSPAAPFARRPSTVRSVAALEALLAAIQDPSEG